MVTQLEGNKTNIDSPEINVYTDSTAWRCDGGQLGNRNNPHHNPC